MGSTGSVGDEEKDFIGGGVEIIPFNELEPRWHTPGATEGGYLRWLTSWVGGPEGHINPNFGRSIISQEASVGFMRLMLGCRQKGVHAHTVVEIYIILKGHIEGYDGLGQIHRAGPMDCVYIPKGVPHGVRNSGTEDLDLLWIHDGIEKKGLSTYYYTEAETPKIGGVSVIKFNNLEPHWGTPRAKEAPFLRWIASYVGGKSGFTNWNPQHAEKSETVGLGLLVVFPGNKQVPHRNPGNVCYVIIQGKALINRGCRGEREVHRLDGIWIPAGAMFSIRNHADEPVWVVWTQEKPIPSDSISYEQEPSPQ